MSVHFYIQEWEENLVGGAGWVPWEGIYIDESVAEKDYLVAKDQNRDVRLRKVSDVVWRSNPTE